MFNTMLCPWTTWFVSVRSNRITLGQDPLLVVKAVRLVATPAPRSQFWLNPSRMAGNPGPNGVSVLNRLPPPIRLYSKPAFVPPCSYADHQVCLSELVMDASVSLVGVRQSMVP